MYALAAGAAGVGALALAQPAEAEIVYTPTWVAIFAGTTTVNLDLNNDGIADFQFSNKVHSCTGSSCSSRTLRLYGTLKVLPQNQSNAIWGTQGSASALGAGVSIGSNVKFHQGYQFMAKGRYGCGRSGSCFYDSNGPWREATKRYLALKFTIQGGTHYGWARLNVTTTNHGVYAAVSGYAYETVANTPIVTGKTTGAAKNMGKVRPANPGFINAATSQPGSLGLLARGALDLHVWRRRDVSPK